MIFLYNFRCRTRIAGGLMIRDYVANQSKNNNKKVTRNNQMVITRDLYRTYTYIYKPQQAFLKNVVSITHAIFYI